MQHYRYEFFAEYNMCSELNYVISHPHIIPEALNIQGFCQHDAYT